MIGLLRRLAGRGRRLLLPGLERRRLAENVKRQTRAQYDRIAGESVSRDLAFMNQGYAILDPGEPAPELASEDESFRFHMQLYYQLAARVEFAGKTALEVGCGRGGGSYFLCRYLQPESMIGLDLSEGNLAIARRLFNLPGLRFVGGDAERLPFPDASVDLVVNVESSHHYPHPERFFAEVRRVLRPDGHFLFTDLGVRGRFDGLAGRFQSLGFEVLIERDITPNVLESIRLDNVRRTAFLRSIAEDEARYRELCDWARTVGSCPYHAYVHGDDEYRSYVVRKS